MVQLADVIQTIADWLFIPFLVIILFGTGLFLTGRLGFVQVRRFGEALRSFFGAAPPAAGRSRRSRRS
jgi:alanine or glycine:cation symporter, AGCS family